MAVPGHVVVPGRRYRHQGDCGAWRHISRWQRKQVHRDNEARMRNGLEPLKKKIECTCQGGGV